jgi:hypothetical protein
VGRLGKDHGNNGDDTAQRERGVRRAERTGRAGQSGQSGQPRLTGPASGPNASRSLPFEFLRLGAERPIGAHPAGRIGERISGPAVQAFEFTPTVVAPDRGAGSSDHSAHPYLVAVVELGFRVPWLAICAHSANQPAQQSAHRFYPGRRSLDLITSDRHVSRDYRLYADDYSQVGALLDGPVRAWLPGALAARTGRRKIVAIEASGTWAMAAAQADSSADSAHDRDAAARLDAADLFSVLNQFRDAIPAGSRR